MPLALRSRAQSAQTLRLRAFLFQLVNILMRPLTVLTGFVMGTCVSIAVSLLFVLIVFAIIGDDFPRVQYEFEPLIKSLAIFTAMTAVSAGSFYTQLIRHPARHAAQVGLLLGLVGTGWYYWP